MSAGIEALSGALAACLSVSATYPLLQVSTWQSLQRGAKTTGSLAQEETAQLEAYARYQVPSPLRELLVYSRTRGAAGMYAGLQPCLVGTAVAQGLYFGFYSAIRQRLVAWRAGGSPVTQAHNDIGIVGSLLVAGLAGCGNVLLANPVWVIVTQAQDLARSPDLATRRSSAWSIIRQLYEREGWRGFYKGLIPSLVMVSNPTLQFMVYEALVSRLLRARSRHQPTVTKLAISSGDAFMLSAVAKLVATLITYPLLVIKSRMQASKGGPAQYKGVLDAVIRIIRSEGWQGLFKGLKAKLLQTVLGAALLMSMKEWVVALLRTLLTQQGGAAALKAR